MRDFTKVSPKIWSSKSFRSLDGDQSRMVYLFLLAGPHQTNAGICRLPPAFAAHDLGMKQESVENSYVQLEKANLIEWDPDVDEIYVKGWCKFNGPMNFKHKQGMLTTINRHESERLTNIARRDVEEALPDRDAGRGNAEKSDDDGETIDDDEETSNEASTIRLAQFNKRQGYA